jgi:hypothetical protein
MIGRRSVIGLSLLCALAVCAFAASGASAAGGTTFVTCKKGGTTLDFKGAHCTTSAVTGTPSDKVELGKGTFSHFKVANGVATTITGSNTATKNETKEAVPAVLIGTVAGIEVEISCTTVSSTGSGENSEPTAENHHIAISGVVVSYSGCTVLKPSLQNCVVKGGTITTNSLKAQDKEDTIVFEPTSGTAFTTITIEKCTTTALNGAFTVTGTVTAKPNGATLYISIPKTTESTLKFAGQPAGLTLVETVRGKKTGGSETAEPLSVTTTPLVLGG